LEVAMKIFLSCLKRKYSSGLVSLFVVVLLAASWSKPLHGVSPTGDIEILGTLYKLRGNMSPLVLYPLVVANAGQRAYEFNRIHIEFKQQKMNRGDVIAQDIYSKDNQMFEQIHMKVMSPGEMVFRSDVKPDRHHIEPGRGIAFRKIPLWGCAKYRGPNPITMEITLFLDETQVSKTHFVVLPKRSTLTISPDVKIEDVTGGPGKELEFKKK
jgi:hypothetical protein